MRPLHMASSVRNHPFGSRHPRPLALQRYHNGGGKIDNLTSTRRRRFVLGISVRLESDEERSEPIWPCIRVALFGARERSLRSVTQVAAKRPRKRVCFSRKRTR